MVDETMGLRRIPTGGPRFVPQIYIIPRMIPLSIDPLLPSLLAAAAAGSILAVSCCPNAAPAPSKPAYVAPAK